VSRSLVKPLLWGLALALYLRFGLTPTGWLFYEASFALHIDALYWGYTLFRGGDHLFGLWPLRTAACIGAGLLLCLLLAWRAQRKERA
jgi:hypothetical protein